MQSSTDSCEIEKKLNEFNQYYENTSSWQITSKMIDERLVFEGRLRIHWGVLHPIRLKQKDDDEPSRDDDLFELDLTQNTSYETLPSPRHKLNGRRVDRTLTMPRGPRVEANVKRHGSVVMRGDVNHRKVREILSVLHGHIYNTVTRVFVPTYGSSANVFITSDDSCSQVLKQLLHKFKVENGAENFCLCIVTNEEETISLRDEEYPLLQRVLRGPDEETAKFFIMEKSRVLDINEQVAQFMNLPEAVLVGFLEKLKNDEECELALIRERQKNIRGRILQQLHQLNQSQA